MSLFSSIINKMSQFEKNFEVYNHIYVSRSAILHNFDILLKLSPNGIIIPVLKSNAYGHGLEQIATILKERKFPYIAVDGYYEAIRIHKISKQPVLIMGAINSVNYAKIRPNGHAFVVHDTDSIVAMGKTNKQFRIHIELETGMGRHGVRIDKLDEFLEIIKKYKHLIVEGVMTHLADADNPKSNKHVMLQIKRFDKGVEKIIESGFNPKFIDAAQSAGSVKIKSAFANTIRPGIAVYGISPLDEADILANKLSGLIPALKLTSTIAKIIDIDNNESVGYGRTFTAKQKCRVGILPIGYYEGLPRSLGNVGKIKWHSQYLPIVGRICMNHTMVKLNDNAKANDQVTIISDKPDDILSVDNICRENNIFKYGLLVGLTSNIRRTIVK